RQRGAGAARRRLAAGPRRRDLGAVAPSRPGGLCRTSGRAAAHGGRSGGPGGMGRRGRMRLLIVGFGYSAGFIAARLVGEAAWIGGTVRDPADESRLAAAGVEPILFDGVA